MGNIFYWAQVLEALDILVWVILVGILIVLLIMFLVYAFDPPYDEEDKNKIKTWMIRCIKTSLVLALIITFVPTKRTFLLNTGAHAVERMYNNNEQLQELPENTLNLLNEYIKTITEELKDDQE